jgi:hypothetical protein
MGYLPCFKLCNGARVLPQKVCTPWRAADCTSSWSRRRCFGRPTKKNCTEHDSPDYRCADAGCSLNPKHDSPGYRCVDADCSRLCILALHSAPWTRSCSIPCLSVCLSARLCLLRNVDPPLEERPVYQRLGRPRSPWRQHLALQMCHQNVP